MSSKTKDVAVPLVPWRYAYDGLEETVSEATGLQCADDSLTIQAFAEDADINVLVKRFGITGTMPAARSLPEYGDFTGPADFQDALNRLDAAQRAFDSLPAEVRRRFGDTPANLLEFLHDPANEEEARKLGLLKPKEAPAAPMRVEVVNTPPAPPEGAKTVE